MAGSQERGSQDRRDYTGGESWTSDVNNEDRYDHRQQINKDSRVRPHVKPRYLMVLPLPQSSWPALALEISPSSNGLKASDRPATISKPLNDSAFGFYHC